MRVLQQLRRLRRNEEGTTLVELAFVIPLFLLMFFMLLDFGRLSYNWVMAEKGGGAWLRRRPFVRLGHGPCVHNAKIRSGLVT